MEVKTVDDTGRSVGAVLVYGVIAGLLTTSLMLPRFVVVEYPDILNTLILLVLFGLIGRTILGAALAVSRPSPPDVDPGTDLPSVSIIVPAYNEAPVLPDTIDACRRLDYPEDKLECLICYEAASTDGTAEIAEAAAADPRFEAVERDEPGGGKAKATNYALGYATGDIIASIDADHRFKPNAVRRAVRWFLADEDTWCVKGRCYGDNPTDSLITLHATVERHIAEVADLFARERLGGFTIFGGGQAFFRAEVFEELGLFDEEVLVEDIDMSSKIHAEGKRLRVDPDIITYEENPPTLEAWWSQRKRWARGWMQVASRYLTTLPRKATLSTRERLDVVFTFSYAVVPALLAFALPMPLMELAENLVTLTYLPHDWLLWAVLPLTPIAAAYPIFLRDRADGLKHHPAEYLAVLTLGVYLGFQMVVFVTAFIDEFVLNKANVYVTTSRSGADP